MARIKSYRCTHNKCRFSVHLSQELPLWHPQTPTHMKKLPVPSGSAQYVIGYRSELFCRYCKKTVESNAEMVCSRCLRSGLYEDEGGRSCPQCLVGRLSLEHQSVL
jgi:hypothetical protein